jgi:acyl carrier protein
MNTEEFMALVRAESGLHIGTDDLHTEFDNLAGWDSVHLLKLLSALEATSGRRLPVTQLLEAQSLGELHALLGEP